MRKLAWMIMASTVTVGVLAVTAPMQSAMAASATSLGSASATHAGSSGQAALAKTAETAAVSGVPSDGPALASPGVGRLELFGRTPGGELHERDFAAGGWGRTASLGGQRWVTGPAAAADRAGHVILVIGGRGSIDYLRFRTAARWSRWVRLPGSHRHDGQ